MNKKKLPWRCSDHPNAKILHSWDRNHLLQGGYAVGKGCRSNQRWECSECGRELASDLEPNDSHILKNEGED